MLHLHDRSIENSSTETDVTSTKLTVDDVWKEYGDELSFKGKILPSSSEIIKEIARKMGKEPKAAQLSIQRKYNKIHPKKEIHDAEEESPNGDEGATDANDSPQNLIEGETCAKSFSKSFNIETAAIFEIESRRVKHRKNEVNRMAVKTGWTSKLALFLWKETKLSCKFDFKSAHVTNDRVIKVKAKCLCGSALALSSHESNLIVDIENINTTFEHNRRYQATGEMKKDLADALKHSSALKVQTEKVNDLICDNEALHTDFVPVLQKLNAYRIIKSREKSTDEDPIDELLKWKDSIYKRVITLVSHSPFTVHYRTAIQLAWYIAQSRKFRITGSVDATGSIVRPPRRSQKIDGTDKLKHIFLYSIMAKTDSKSIPIAQMITQDQSSENIEFFLKKMFKHPIKPPAEFVCDESKALMKALISAFTKCQGIEEFIDQCMQTLQTGAAPPKCRIKLDRAHFIKNAEKKIKDRDHRKRNFYRCVIGYLITCDDFNIAKAIIRDFFTIILNEYDGNDEHGEPLPSEISKKRLISLVGTHNVELNYADDSNERDGVFEVDVNTQWIDEIIKKVPVITTGTHLNLFYNKNDYDMYVKFFSTIVLWSNVMNKSFGSTATVATSADVESSFNSLKNGILAGDMLKAHKFVHTHVEFVNAEVKLNAIRTNRKEPSEKTQKRKRSNSLNETPPIKMRNRSNSNQYEQSIHIEDYSGNGKIKNLELYDLVGSIFTFFKV